MRTFLGMVAIALLLAWSGIGSPATSGTAEADLTSLSLEELMDIEVTSVSKKMQKLSDTAAAVYVITLDDIRRSGANCIPDVLRMVPGVNVAQIDASKWAVSVRGFNGRYSNKLLVMVDGRSIYTPTFSGVYWDAQNPLMDDIDRIEVIRGPGGSLWGANAVNGVINIITKSASQTQQNLMASGTGGEEKRFTDMRFAGSLGGDATYRVYARQFSRDNRISDMDMTAGADGWDMQNGGFRADWRASDYDQLTVEGNVYNGNLGQELEVPLLAAPYEQTVEDKYPASGWNVLAYWNHTDSQGSEAALQMYFDHTRRSPIEITEVRNTLNLDYQHRMPLSGNHDVMWGVSFRRSSDDTSTDSMVALNPASQTDNLFTSFISDEVKLREMLSLTLGTKYEHNDYTGSEFQPTVRLAWTPDTRRTLWAAVSRAVRTPNRIERQSIMDVYTDPGDGFAYLYRLMGDPEFTSERVVAHELGARVRPTDRLSLDVSAFYNVYSNLRSWQIGDPIPMLDEEQPHVIVPVYFANMLHGSTTGYEAALAWDATRNWRVRFGYSRLNYDLEYDPASNDPFGLEGDSSSNSAPNQWFVTSYLDLGRNVELDTMLYYTGALFGMDRKSFHRLDVHLGYRPRQAFEVSLVGQNLLDREDAEHDGALSEIPTHPQKSIFGKLTWFF